MNAASVPLPAAGRRAAQSASVGTSCFSRSLSDPLSSPSSPCSSLSGSALLISSLDEDEDDVAARCWDASVLISHLYPSEVDGGGLQGQEAVS